MAVKRISDLSNILVYKKNEKTQAYTINQGVNIHVLGGGANGDNTQVNNERTYLKNSLFEVSWNESSAITRYDSKNITYENLCAYITHNIQLEDYFFKGKKSLSGELSVNGQINLLGNQNITGDVNVNGSNFNVKSTNINLSGVNISVDASQDAYIKGKDTYIYGTESINLSVEDNTVPIYLIYQKELKIQYKAPNGEIKDVMTFYAENGTPKIKVETNSNVGTENNPLFTTAQYARWG